MASYKTSNFYSISIERLRLVLMLLMCINLMGFPTAWGGLIQEACSWTPIAFFILSGYLVLRPEKGRSSRIARTIKRTLIVFVALAVFYLGIGFVFYRQLGVNIFQLFLSKRVWFELVVLNTWPLQIGSAIWYVQSLLYAYIIIFILDKLKLLKFDWIIIILCIILAMLSGELAGIFRFNILGYSFFPGNFLTRALPYTLLGGFIHKHLDFFDKIGRGWYVLIGIGGLALMFAEIIVLSAAGFGGYFGHLIGMPIVALAVCILFGINDNSFPTEFERRLNYSRWDINLIYYLGQPIGILLAAIFSFIGHDFFVSISGYIGIIAFFVCLLIGFLIAFIRSGMGRRKKKARVEKELREISYAELAYMEEEEKNK